MIEITDHLPYSFEARLCDASDAYFVTVVEFPVLEDHDDFCRWFHVYYPAGDRLVDLCTALYAGGPT